MCSSEEEQEDASTVEDHGEDRNRVPGGGLSSPALSPRERKMLFL